MKITQENNFQPVHITLDTQREVDGLWVLLNNTAVVEAIGWKPQMVIDLMNARSIAGTIEFEQPVKALLEAHNYAKFLQDSMTRIAEACGVGSPLQLTMLAENNAQTATDLLVKHIETFGVEAKTSAKPL